LKRQIRSLARRAAAQFHLKFKEIKFDETLKDWGYCDKEGVIEMRLTKHKTGRVLGPKVLIDTLAHELAHLEHFNHRTGHKVLHIALVVWLARNWT
jgi:predicted metal-dependent hydrolase